MTNSVRQQATKVRLTLIIENPFTVVKEGH